ncbi:MAG: hypothetical protein LUD50_02005 [Clostridia bacterium]|nr:hypothetical protein [Clostridia bacterium]
MKKSRIITCVAAVAVSACMCASLAACTIGVHEHTWDTGTVTKEASCTEQGEITYTCSDCGATMTAPIAATGHNYVETNTATCEEAGQIKYVCTNCGETDPDVTAVDSEALGHDWIEDESSETATCTSSGTAVYVCSRCGETKSETVDKLGHNYVFDVRDIPCVGTVTLTGVCTRCGEEVTIKTDGTGHHYVLASSTEATCTEDGIDTFVCTRCSEKADGHSYQVVTAEKLGHDWVETTSTEEGDGVTITTTTKTCSRCGASETSTTTEDSRKISTWDGVAYSYDWLKTADTSDEEDEASAAEDGDEEDAADSITTYTISSCAELAGFAKYVNGEYTSSYDSTLEGCVVQLNPDVDFDLDNKPWTPIGYETPSGDLGPFKGTFDGNGSTIYNLYDCDSDPDTYDLTTNQTSGFFGYIYTATIENVTIENAIVMNGVSAGALVGVCDSDSASNDLHSVFINCTIKGVIQVTGSQYVGGIVGDAAHASFTNCSVIGNEVTDDLSDDEISFIKGKAIPTYSGVIFAGGYVGGITGNLVTTSHAPIGSFKPYMYDVTVKNLEITGSSYVGGLIGAVDYEYSTGCIAISKNPDNEEASGNTISNCTISATGGALFAAEYVGAIIGYIKTNSSDTAISDVTITDVTISAGIYNTGETGFALYGAIVDASGTAISSITFTDVTASTITTPAGTTE